MLREKLKWKTHKSESINVQHGVGTTHSSDEVSVMEMERRGRVVHVLKLYNLKKWEDTMEKSKVIQYIQRLSARGLQKSEG